MSRKGGEAQGGGDHVAELREIRAAYHEIAPCGFTVEKAALDAAIAALAAPPIAPAAQGGGEVVSRQRVSDQFEFLEGLVNHSTYREIVDKAAELIRTASPSAPVGVEWLANDDVMRLWSQAIEQAAQEQEAEVIVFARLLARALAQQPAAVDGAATNSAVAAIQFALGDPEGMTFLRLWNEGEFDTLRREWPDAPVEVYIDADPLAALAQQPAAVDGVVLHEYIEARDAYEAATRPPNSHAPAPRLKHGDPIVLRYREARAALAAQPQGGA